MKEKKASSQLDGRVRQITMLIIHKHHHSISFCSASQPCIHDNGETMMFKREVVISSLLKVITND